MGHKFTVREDAIYEREYQINPYLDLNGVNLLYFAAYPTINDVCEASFFNEQHPDKIKEHWAKEAYTAARDIYYMNNCNLNDSIIYRIHEATFLSDNKVGIASSLIRKSDGNHLARIFTVKQIL